MPRLIPRLLRAIEHARSRPPRFTRRTPPPVIADKCVFKRPDEVDISPRGRTRSILLDRNAVRLIYRHARYRRTKSLAPEVHVSKARWRAKQMLGRAPLGVFPREMTEEERSYHANPYLRMLGSPLRQCFHTGWLLPREMLIRMTTMKLPDSPSGKQQYAFLPSALEHPSFTRYQGGRSSYMLCHKQVIDSVRERGSYKRFSPDGGMTVMHSLTGQQIGHILRVRVIQELQLLARRLLRVRRLAKPADPPLLRRLTRAEWNEIKATGVIPYKNAVAVLVVPPPNRHPETKERPTPVATSTPDLEDLEGKEPPRSLPISVLHPTFKEEQQWKDDPLSKIVPPSLVPLYNGVSLFPSRTQRAALHATLSEVLRAERTTRLMTGSQPALTGEVSSTTGRPARAKGDKKASHAILLCSDERTILRADTVPLAIALWRLRMWEGDIDEEAVVHWMAEPSRIP